MYAIVIDFETGSKPHTKDFKELHWLAVHSFFEYLFPDTFICVLKPYNNSDAQAKVFFKEIISIPNGDNQVEIDNNVAVIVDSQEVDDLPATRTRVLRFPRQPVGLAEASAELQSWLKARVNCVSESTGCVVSVTACHEEVLEAALGKLSALEGRSQSAGGGGATESASAAAPASISATAPPPPPPPAAARAARKPLFPAAFASPQPPPPPPTPTTNKPAAATSPRQSGGGEAQRVFHLGPSCRLTVCVGDLTAVAGMDLVVATTNGALSLKRGLASALAARLDAGGLRSAEAECARHLRALPHHGLDFGATYLLERGCAGAFDRVLLVSLTNDRRLGDQLGSGQAFRRVMDRCLAELVARLVRLADERKGGGGGAGYRVAMPTVGSTLPLWGHQAADEWAEALAGALASLAGRAGRLGEVRVCCVGLEVVDLLGGALARLLGNAPPPPSPPDTPAAAPAAAATAASGIATGTVSGGGDGKESDPGQQGDDYADSDGGSSAIDSDAEAATESMSIDDEVTTNGQQRQQHQQSQSNSAPATTCQLCAEDFSAANPATPFHCDHSGNWLCRGCVARLNGPSPSDGKCVLCFQRYRPATGCQPTKGARMSVAKEAVSLPGFDRCGTLVVTYEFEAGVHEGQHYRASTRTAYLPDNSEGQQLLQRLRAAYDGRVVFNVGPSATTGRSNAITWNTLHHKTSRSGGPSSHGYPDHGYLKRLGDELSALGY